MRLDEMIIKASADGKTYFCNGTDLEYSKEKGFTGIDPSDQIRKFTDIVLVNEWLEKPKRHLTVSEAEKELDCEIDTPDISKLLRSPKEHPTSCTNVIVLIELDNIHHTSYYDKNVNTWYVWSSCQWVESCEPVCWIDPEDLIKLLPKE